MAISRAQMGSQLTGNKMKKKPTKKPAAFTTCATCPSPAKCRAAGKCAKKK